MENFKTEICAGNVKAAMKAVGAVSADLWQVHPSKLRILPDFNARVRNQAYEDRVRWIANSIQENGFYKDKPLSGFVARENGEDVIYVTGGHRRHEAVHLAISEGAEIETVPVIVSPKGTSIEDLTVALVVGNDGEPLSKYESAIVCKRLAGFGWSSAQIAKRIGYSSAQYVDDLLLLASAPLAVRKMVIEEVVSATTAIAALVKHGDHAQDVLLEALVKSSNGRVTGKHMPHTALSRQLKKQAEPMFNALTNVTHDPAFISLSLEVRAQIAELLRGIKK